MPTVVYRGQGRQWPADMPMPNVTGRLVHEIFEDQVRRVPHASAVLHNEHLLTYAALNAKSNQLARFLVNQGVGPGKIVAVCAVRSIDMIVSLMAVLKAAGAYLFLDPDYPPERVQHVLQDAAPHLVLAQAELTAILADASVEVVAVDRKLKEISGYVSENLSPDELGLRSRNLLYVVHTANSADRLEATAMLHSSIVNLIEWHCRTFREPSRVLQLAFPDFLSTLCMGGTLVLMDEWIRRDPRKLAEVIVRDSIQRVFVRPKELHELAEFYSCAKLSMPILRDVITGAKQLRLTPEIINFFSQMPECRLHNNCVTTDARGVMSLTLDEDPRRWPGFPAAGDPIENVHLYPLGEIREPVQAPTSLLPPLADNERRQVIELFNSSRAIYPRNKLIHQLFEEQAARSPNAAAVVVAGNSLSYAQMNARTNQLARYLRRRGVGPNERVGICLERGLEMVIGLLGALKAGAAYLPLDYDQPTERLVKLLEDARPAVVLTQASRRNRLLAIQTPLVFIDEQSEEIAREEELNLDPFGLTSESLAYVMYTSGSTGQPKGVMVRHRNVVNYAIHAVRQFDIAAGEGSLVGTSMNFDLALTGFYPPLLCGRAVRLSAEGEDLSQALLSGRNYSPVKLTPTHLSILSLPEGDMEGRVQVLVVGGELLQGSALRWWRQYSPGTRIFNHYGPTETTIGCVVHEVLEDLDGPVPIGSPISNVQVYILDDHRLPVQIGVVGEIYIGGDGVALGYWNRPALTAERFLPNPFSGDPQARIYQTGDLGRWRADGVVEYLGRNDDQVKIRGFRIELGEIGAQLVRHKQVKEAVVIAREDTSGDKRLVAYVTASGEARPTAETLRAHLKAVLPDYMVPNAFVVLEHLPLTPNSKLDRRALPAPDANAHARGEYEAPQGEVEELLSGIWQELLKVESVGRNDNFFELGGHSLLVVKMMERLRQLGLSTELRTVYEAPSLAGFARALAINVTPGFEVPPNRIPAGSESIIPEMLPLIELEPGQIARIIQSVPGGARNIRDIYPLTSLQEGILFHHLFHEGGGGTYVLPRLLAIPSRRRLNDFIDALQVVIDRHDILRTAVLWQDLPRPVQVVYHDVKLPVEYLELDGEHDVRKQLEVWMEPEHQKLDLTRAPLVRLRVAADPHGMQWYVLLQVHHIVSDHQSKAKMLLEVMECLQGNVRTLPAPVPYRDHVARVLKHGQSHDAEAFFRQKLGDVDEPTVPFGILDVRVDASRINESQATLEPALARRIRIQSQRLGVSAAIMFHAAWALLVSHTSGRDDVVFGTVLLGRMQSTAEAQGALGMFINTLPLRIGLRGLTACELVERTLRELLDLLHHEQASLSVAQRCAGIGAAGPLFSALLNYVHDTARVNSEEWNTAAGIEILAGRDWTNYPIVVSVEEQSETFLLNSQTDWRVDPRRLTAYLRTAVLSLVDALELAPETSALKLSVLPEDERRHIVTELNATQRTYPNDRSIHVLFEEQVRRMPNALALICDSQQISYVELNARANRLARYLLEQGVQPNEYVGILMERCPAQVVAQLAILKCGGVYVPIDPKLPLERQAFMIRDCGTRRVLMDEGNVTRSEQGNPQWIDITAAELASENLCADNLGHLNTVPSPAYLMYTSGSTGTPKGVMVPQYAIASLVIGNGYAEIGPEDCIVYCSNPTFDASTFEVWGALLNGARVLIVPQSVVFEAKRFSQVLEQQGVTIMFLTIGLFTQHADVLAPVLPQLRYLMTGGDVVDPALVRRVIRNGPPQRFMNVYGPTECTAFSTTFTVEAVGNDVTVLPIGRPIGNVSIYILNTELEPVPIGAIGEIYIGGTGVALGYLNQPELTAKQFVADPFGQTPGARLYRSGDLGRWLGDGCVEFRGRNDCQVKVRGYRIELGEIETRLTQHAYVKEAVVVAREDVPGQKRLVAYITPAAHAAPTAESLRDYLNAVLPDYMVPTAFVILEKLPLTPSGKLARRALPAPALDAYVSRQYEPPLGETEEVIARIWSELLRVDRIGRSDHFFELGGHSLLAMQVMVRIRSSLSIDIPISELFDHPLLKEFAVQVEERREERMAERLASGDAELDELLARVTSMPEHEVDKMISELRGEMRS